MGHGNTLSKYKYIGFKNIYGIKMIVIIACKLGVVTLIFLDLCIVWEVENKHITRFLIRLRCIL